MDEVRAPDQVKAHDGHAQLKGSVDYLSVALAFTGEGLEFLGFIQRHPDDTHCEC